MSCIDIFARDRMPPTPPIDECWGRSESTDVTNHNTIHHPSNYPTPEKAEECQEVTKQLQVNNPTTTI